MQFISSSVGPSTCGVFLSRVEVFLEGEFGRSAHDFIATRGPSRFGQVNCWINGQPPASVIPDELEKADLFILVGSSEELRPRIIELAPYLKLPSSIVLVITVGDLDAIPRLKINTGLEKLISISLQPETQSQVALVLDSLTALHYFYENALNRFTLFDLRHIWPDGVDLEVQHYCWPEPNDDLNAVETVVSLLTSQAPDMNSPHLLSVLRGSTALSDKVITEIMGRLFASDANQTRFWYTVIQPPASTEHASALIFSTAKPSI